MSAQRARRSGLDEGHIFPSASQSVIRHAEYKAWVGSADVDNGTAAKASGRTVVRICFAECAGGDERA